MLDNTISALEAALELEHKAREALPALIAEREHLQGQISQLDSAIQRFGGFKEAAEQPNGHTNGHVNGNGHAKPRKPSVVAEVKKAEPEKVPARRGRPKKDSGGIKPGELVLKALRESKEPLASIDIINVIKKANPSVVENAIHGAIFRLKNSGKISAEGRAKSYKYSISD